MRQQNFLLVEKVHRIFSAQQGRGSNRSLDIPILNILIRCRNMSGQGLKLSEIVHIVDFE